MFSPKSGLPSLAQIWKHGSNLFVSKLKEEIGLDKRSLVTNFKKTYLSILSCGFCSYVIFLFLLFQFLLFFFGECHEISSHPQFSVCQTGRLSNSNGIHNMV